MKKAKMVKDMAKWGGSLEWSQRSNMIKWGRHWTQLSKRKMIKAVGFCNISCKVKKCIYRWRCFFSKVWNIGRQISLSENALIFNQFYQFFRGFNILQINDISFYNYKASYWSCSVIVQLNHSGSKQMRRKLGPRTTNPYVAVQTQTTLIDGNR